METLKYRILMCFLVSSQENCTVTGIARTLREEKYKISRAMIRMEQEGLVDRTQVRAPQLTELGRQEAERYCERVRVAQNHLFYAGMPMEGAKEDGSLLALYCSDELIRLIDSHDEYDRVRQEMREERSFSGASLCRRMRDGSYTLPFVIYRAEMDENHILSMANDGFEHPCTLRVENGVGVVQLRLLGMSGRTQKNKQLLHGKLHHMEYYSAGRYISAELHGDVVMFPAEALHFTNMGEGQVFHGSVWLKMQSTCGDDGMPVAQAVFTLLF